MAKFHRSNLGPCTNGTDLARDHGYTAVTPEVWRWRFGHCPSPITTACGQTLILMYLSSDVMLLRGVSSLPPCAPSSFFAFFFFDFVVFCFLYLLLWGFFFSALRTEFWANYTSFTRAPVKLHVRARFFRFARKFNSDLLG